MCHRNAGMALVVRRVWLDVLLPGLWKRFRTGSSLISFRSSGCYLVVGIMAEENSRQVCGCDYYWVESDYRLRKWYSQSQLTAKIWANLPIFGCFFFQMKAINVFHVRKSVVPNYQVFLGEMKRLHKSSVAWEGNQRVQQEFFNLEKCRRFSSTVDKNSIVRSKGERDLEVLLAEKQNNDDETSRNGRRQMHFKRNFT